MAESERYLPVLIDHVEKIIEEAGLRHDSITMRMTGESFASPGLRPPSPMLIPLALQDALTVAPDHGLLRSPLLARLPDNTL